MCATCWKRSIRHSDQPSPRQCPVESTLKQTRICGLRRFDRSAEDLFALQDEITNWIAKALKRRATSGRGSATGRAPRRALDCIRREAAPQLINRGRSPLWTKRSGGMSGRWSLDPPASTEAQTHLAAALAYRIQDFHAQKASSDADIERAGEAGSASYKCRSPRSARAHNSMAGGALLSVNTQRRFSEYRKRRSLSTATLLMRWLPCGSRARPISRPVDDAILVLQQCAIRLQPPVTPHSSIGISESARLICCNRRRRSGNPLARKGAQQWPGGMVCV